MVNAIDGVNLKRGCDAKGEHMCACKPSALDPAPDATLHKAQRKKGPRRLAAPPQYEHDRRPGGPRSCSTRDATAIEGVTPFPAGVELRETRASLFEKPDEVGWSSRWIEYLSSVAQPLLLSVNLCCFFFYQTKLYKSAR